MLKQETFPVFCDEGVFRIVLDIFMNNLDEFNDLLPMLRGFYMVKAVLHAIRKYIKGSGLDDILKYTVLWTKNIRISSSRNSLCLVT